MIVAMKEDLLAVIDLTAPWGAVYGHQIRGTEYGIQAEKTDKQHRCLGRMETSKTHVDLPLAENRFRDHDASKTR